MRPLFFPSGTYFINTLSFDSPQLQLLIFVFFFLSFFLFFLSFDVRQLKFHRSKKQTAVINIRKYNHISGKKKKVESGPFPKKAANLRMYRIRQLKSNGLPRGGYFLIRG